MLESFRPFLNTLQEGMVKCFDKGLSEVCACKDCHFLFESVKIEIFEGAKGKYAGTLSKCS